MIIFSGIYQLWPTDYEQEIPIPLPPKEKGKDLTTEHVEPLPAGELLSEELPIYFQNIVKIGLRKEADGTMNLIKIIEGNLNGQDLNLEHPLIHVKSGNTIKGNIFLRAHNSHGKGDVFPAGWTPSWGDHKSSIRTIAPWAQSEDTRIKVPIEVTAPTEAGDYFIAFACAAQMRVSNIMSTTAWMRREDKWDDDNDVASLSPAQVAWGIRRGWFPVKELVKADEYEPSYYGGTAIIVKVTP